MMAETRGETVGKTRGWSVVTRDKTRDKIGRVRGWNAATRDKTKDKINEVLRTT